MLFIVLQAHSLVSALCFCLNHVLSQAMLLKPTVCDLKINPESIHQLQNYRIKPRMFFSPSTL